MKIERGVFCRILFPLFADNRKGLEVDAEGLNVLQTRETRQPGSIPFVEISGLTRVRKRLFRSAVEVPLMNGKRVDFGGVDPVRAREFAHALNEAWEMAWRQKLEPHIGPIQSLAGVIERLENPRKFPAACLVDPFWKKSEDILRCLPVDLPGSVLAPGIQECIAKIAEFHEAPDCFRDKAVDRLTTRELEAMARFFETIKKTP